jgi:hydroxymethylbilane synthase
MGVSDLANIQANWVSDRLKSMYPDRSLEVIQIRTCGDRMRDITLVKIECKGIFEKEIEGALLRGNIDNEPFA